MNTHMWGCPVWLWILLALAIGVGLALVSGSAEAATYHVNPGGSIQSAVNAAMPGWA